MSSVERNAKIYGAVETETNITFTGFCKKIYDTEQQEVEVFIDDKKIDVIPANQKISNIEDTYEVFDTEGFCFTYKLPKEFIGEKHKLEFKTINGEQLIHSPIITMDQEHPKYNENCFLESLNEPIDEIKIKNMYCPNSIGFLATEENLEDEEFCKFIFFLAENYNLITFKIFYFNPCKEIELYEKFQSIEIKHLMIINDIEQMLSYSNIIIHNLTNNVPIDYKLRYCQDIYKHIISIEFTNEFKKQKNLSEINIEYMNDLKLSSIFFNIFSNHVRINEFKLLNDLNSFDKKVTTSESTKSSIGFLITKENVKNETLFKYVNYISNKFPSVSIKAFCYNEDLRKIIINDLEIIYFTDPYEICKSVDIFLYTGNLTKLFDLIERKLYLFFINFIDDVACLDINVDNVSIEDFDLLNKESLVLNKSEEFGINIQTIKKYNFSYTRVFYEYLCKLDEFNITIDEKSSAFDFYLNKRISLLLDNKEFKQNYINIIWKLFNV